MSGNDRITNNPVSLTYTKTLTGQQLNEVSLDLKNENATMYMNGRAVVYSAVGYALDSIKIKMDGLPEIEINKQLLDECVQTQTRYKYMSDTFNMSFRLDMDNQFIQVVIQQALRKVGVNDNQIADLSNRMQRNTEITWCYVLGEKLIIKHETENGISLTSPETIPITTNPVTPVPKPKYFDGYEFVSYKLDGHHTTDLTDEQKNTIINNGLSVERTGNDRELIFIYQPQEQEVVDGRIVELRSASRREELTSDYKSEEYSVDGKLLAGDAENANKGAIPTSEDLYANVMVEEFNIKSGAQLKANINETQRFEIYFVQQYVERNEEEDSNSTSDQQYATEDNIIKLSVADELIEFDLGYNYYTAENAELQIINYANVKNEHIIQNPNEEPSNFGFAKLVPQYAREPRMEFVRGGSLTVDKSNNTEISDGRVVSAALPSGLYNVDDTSEPGVIKAYFVLSSVEYSTPTIKDLVSKYDEDPSIMGAEIGELRDNILKTTKVKLDLLRVLSSIPSRNPEYYTIFSGADVYLLDAQNLDVLIQAGHIDLTPEVALIERDVLYSENQKNKEKGYNEIYIKENTLNEIEDTKADVYYKTVQKLKEGIFYNVGSDGKFYEQLSVGSDGTPIFSNTPNEDM